MATVPFDLAVNVAVGASFALASRLTLRHEALWRSVSLWALLGLQALVLVPVGAYVLWRFPEWSYMYLAEAGGFGIPDPAMALTYVPAAVLGWFAVRLLIRRGKAPRLGQWSIPGGAQHLGETLLETAAREVREETGLGLRGLRFLTTVDLIEREPPPDGRVRYHYTLIDFVAEAEEGDAVPGDDAAAVAWFAEEELAGLGLWSETIRVIAASRELRPAIFPSTALTSRMSAREARSRTPLPTSRSSARARATSSLETIALSSSTTATSLAVDITDASLPPGGSSRSRCSMERQVTFRSGSAWHHTRRYHRRNRYGDSELV